MNEQAFTPVRAEIIAIGDELTSGQRLDTNSQWLSQQLNRLGITVSFHSTVGDDFDDKLNVFRNAIDRSDIVVCTGGLGPTADDLTRYICEQISGCKLSFDSESFDHIQSLFQRANRKMPESNRVQAMFPEGSKVIPNSLGTAPGFEIEIEDAVLVALPGVPAELKEMWTETVQPRLLERFKIEHTIYHHAVHLFGKGESEIETILGELTQRDRQPRVGITASQATISLRIQALALNSDDFRNQIDPILQTIQDRVGALVYGENEQTLQQVVIDLLSQKGQTIAVVDQGHSGLVAQWLSQADEESKLFAGSYSLGNRTPDLDPQSIRERFDADYLIYYQVKFPDRTNDGRFEVSLDIIERSTTTSFSLSGASHPSIREARIGKWVLNQFRLQLLNA